MSRCTWAKSPQEIDYHDQEWGVPLHDDQKLFEFLILEGAQAGLSWNTVLQKRPRYREVFDHFDPKRVATYDNLKVSALMNDPGIIRNRLKIGSAITNAKHFLAVQKAFGSFDRYLWEFVDGSPIINRWEDKSQIPTSTPISDALSKNLRQRGFKFVGTTIIYALMQATGMVNDHTTDCFRHPELCRPANPPT